MSAEERIRELGLELGSSGAPAGNYVPAVRTGSLVFISGQLPTRPDGTRPTGKLGQTMAVDEGYAAARLCAVAMLARLREEVGSLDNVKRIVKVVGYVNAAPDFVQQPQVVNGASDLLAEVFGDAGKHARAAIGVSSLPAGVPVEVELIAEVAPRSRSRPAKA
ncbi:MAG TPA: RidA family protein [Dehalococcoidia bacterium]|nr:RidA family protein [Dehalococcoidia bacterium]